MQVTDAVATTAGRSIGLAVIEGLEEDLAETETLLQRVGRGFLRLVQTLEWGVHGWTSVMREGETGGVSPEQVLLSFLHAH